MKMTQSLSLYLDCEELIESYAVDISIDFL